MKTALLSALLLAALVSDAPAYTPTEVADGGAVKGTVKFLGAVPAPKAVQVIKDPEYCGLKPIYEEFVVVSPSQGLRNVIVFIQKIKAGKAIAPGEAWLANEHCRYEPHVQAFVVGTDLKVKNADPILHNTHIKLPKSDVFNYGLPAKDQVISRVVKRKGLMKIGCDAGHTWMNGYIAVFDHPYFAVTDAEGAFSIPDLPPGKYKLAFWHEKFGQQIKNVEITAGGTATVDVDFK